MTLMVAMRMVGLNIKELRISSHITSAGRGNALLVPRYASPAASVISRNQQ
jgi:hypothetical protein